MENALLPTKWISPEIVCSYPHLHEMSEDQSGRKSYNLSIPLPKADKEANEKLKQCMVNAAVNAWGEKYRTLQGVKHFVTDGDPEDSIYKDTVKFSAKAPKRQPGCVDQHMRPVPPEKIEETFYPGAIIRVSVSAYATDKGGSKTVAFALNNVMFVRDGERLGGSSSADDDFGEFATPVTNDFADSAGADLF
jgi:hypothetical protein